MMDRKGSNPHSRPVEVGMSETDLSAVVDEHLVAFERAAADGRVPDIDPFLPPEGDPARGEVARELVRVALELRWARRDHPRLQEYLDRYPELADPEATAAVAFEDYRQRLLAGEPVSPGAYRQAYGVDVDDWPSPDAPTVPIRRGPTSVASNRKRPKPADAPTEQISGPPRVPAVPDTAPAPQSALDRLLPPLGETSLGFRLVRELGRGAFGRVYLAEQADLAGRPVALKVAPRLAGEVRTLARLQHTNIVPVYSAHQAPPLTALCMPFFGATTLASVLADVETGERPTSGLAIAGAIRRRRESRTESGPEPAAVALLESSSYVDAVLWMGERLADALAHAHEKGIVHRDLKPANVLLADDGTPMLLDFNLADDENESGIERARVGGTLPYMAPEQMRAFAGDRSATVDGRADVYALGVVLFHLLARRPPYPEYLGETATILERMQADRRGPVPFLRPDNPDVSPAVESIIRTCLEPDPAKRYPSAAALRDDLARQRANLPLKFAPEPSKREGVRKWVRRHPRVVSAPALAAYAAAVLLFASAIAVRLSLNARAHRQDAERAAALRQFEDFRTLVDAIKFEAGSPGGSAKVLELGTTALDRYGATGPGWEDRPEVARLPAPERDQLRSNIGEIAFLAARAAALLHRDADYAARLNAVAGGALDADAKPVAAAQRSDLTGVTPNELAGAAGAGGRGDFLRGCDLAFRGRYREALPLAEAFTARHPDDFGGWFLKARCLDTLGRYDDALAAYATAGALRPRSAVPLAARAGLAVRLGRDLAQARADLDRALQLEPDLVDARLTRALVLRKLGAYREALADLDALVNDDRSPTRVYFVRAEVRDAAGDKAGAAADRAEGMKREPRDPASFVTRGRARERTDPEGALTDYRAAERLDPLYIHALINIASVLGERLDRPAEALAATDRLLEVYPDHPIGRGGRAVYLARLGQTDKAVIEARQLLVGSPPASAYYHAGCVLALAAKSDPKYRDEAVRLVATALSRGFGHEYLLGDTDLAAIRSDERFRKLADGVKVMTDLAGKR
jgi:serine/threonine protein kinase/Flp pilus assembly protein TadD